MAQIAEDVLLLLLDNASAQPALERDRCDRVLAGAMLLDLAYACRIRPAVPGDRVADGLLLALAGGGPVDAIGEPALALLQLRPVTPTAAVAKLRKDATDHVATHLERGGQLRRIPLSTKRFSRTYAFPLMRRERVGAARAALLAALFDRRPPTPATAGIVTLLHAVDGLGALLSLNDRGWRWVHARATEIAGGGWVDELPANSPSLHSLRPQPTIPVMNLAVTAAAVRTALA